MTEIKYIFFDCMETIVDLYELPNQSDYALWAFANSEVEHYWSGFDEFWQKYVESKNEISSSLEEHQEYEMIRRIEMIVNRTKSIGIGAKSEITKKLYMNFWETYKSKCYIKSEIKEIVSELAGKYRLAVVSNFMVKYGIEELLKINGLNKEFDFITTSINVGWRKPDPKIYEISIASADCDVEEIVFIGDDVENDYFAPRRMGMRSIFLDKEGSGPDIDKVRDFKELRNKLLG